MVDVTQTQACIQCGACVSSCLSLEVDPGFIGPAALAKAWRFVGDPRDAGTERRVRDLAEDPHGIYDCTHCFNCIDACPKGVAPMNQIMRLRRVANSDLGIVDANNGHRHERAFVDNVRRNGWLNEGDLLVDSYGGRTSPRAVPPLVQSLPAILTALRRGKVTREALGHPHRRRTRDITRLVDDVAARPERLELNLYVSGYEDDPTPAAGATAGRSMDATAVATGPNARRMREVGPLSPQQ
jgi:succinate dehydrogenase / fumarate reductase iron-sulfur subunit